MSHAVLESYVTSIEITLLSPKKPCLLLIFQNKVYKFIVSVSVTQNMFHVSHSRTY